MRMVINTPYGDYYAVDLATGNMTQSNWNGEPKYQFSGQWKFKAFKHVKRNEIIPFTVIQKNPDLLKSINWTWKNGNPQWTVMDIDNGTTRVTGNTRWHGVKYAAMVGRP